jgi:hypothetical protein
VLPEQDERRASQGDCTSFPILGLVEGFSTALEVHIRPARREKFLLTPPSCEGKDDDGVQGLVLTSFTRDKQTLAFLVAEEANSPAWFFELCNFLCW